VLIRATISEIESSFTTIDRRQARTRLALTLSLLEGSAQASPRFGRPTAVLRAELEKLDVDDRHYWISTFYTLLMSTAVSYARIHEYKRTGRCFEVLSSKGLT
jgi:adenine-specific DNA-methyltransferase